MRSKMNNILNQEHSGFAITLEVLCTLVLMATFLFLILFLIMVMNGQRYMNTVLTTTAAQAARWGGTNSVAYIENVEVGPLLTNAQAQLNAVVPEFGATITGSPAHITSPGQRITLTIAYHLPNAFNSIGTVRSPSASSNLFATLQNLSMTVNVTSVYKSGVLLNQ